MPCQERMLRLITSHHTSNCLSYRSRLSLGVRTFVTLTILLHYSCHFTNSDIVSQQQQHQKQTESILLEEQTPANSEVPTKQKFPRVTLYGLEEVVNLQQSLVDRSILGLVEKNDFYDNNNNKKKDYEYSYSHDNHGGEPQDDSEDIHNNVRWEKELQALHDSTIKTPTTPQRLTYNELHKNDLKEDSFFDPLAPDPSCIKSTPETQNGDVYNEATISGEANWNDYSCWHPPDSTVEEELVQLWKEKVNDDKKETSEIDCNINSNEKIDNGLKTLFWGYGGNDPDEMCHVAHTETLDCYDDTNQKKNENYFHQPQSECKNEEESSKENHIASNQNKEGAVSASSSSTHFKSVNHGKSHDAFDSCSSDTHPSSLSSPPSEYAKHMILVDKHWGSDRNILRMRDRLRGRRSKLWDWIEQQQAQESIKPSTDQSNQKEFMEEEGDVAMIDSTKRGNSPLDPSKKTEMSRNEIDLGETKQQKSPSSPSSYDSETKSYNKKSPPRRPPVFLLPGLASTRLVSWKHKPCPQNPLLSDIKMLDYVWLNMNLLIQMATIDTRCWTECMTLGSFQNDADDIDEYDYDDDYDDQDVVNYDDVSNERLLEHDSNGDRRRKYNSTKYQQYATNTARGSNSKKPSFYGCKLRPDEGLDAISSLAPGSISSSLLVGGTNTVYAWLIQWLADNLGYDVSSIVALPYDWRLSPDIMEERDGFLTLTKMKIEAAVKSNGLPGIMVAHSMGNSVFRYFLEWLRVQMREQVYEKYVQKAEERAASRRTAVAAGAIPPRGPFWRGQAWVRYYLPGGGDNGDNYIPDNMRVNSFEEDDDQLTDAILDEVMQFVPHDNESDGRTTGSSDVNNGVESSHLAEENEHTYLRQKESPKKYHKLWEVAKIEGDKEWIEWLGRHIWTYIGLAAPLLGAPGPLRSVLSGENMGLPFTDEEARQLELSFGSTSTVNPISTKMGFCDGIDNEEAYLNNRSNLACLDELIDGIESTQGTADKGHDPWKNFPSLRLLLKDRVDFDSNFPIVRVEREFCDKSEKSPCKNETRINFGPADVMNGHVLKEFSNIWKEENDPLGRKFEQLRQSWWNTRVPNPLLTTPDRPHIKHVIMAYGTDVPTEVGYVYRKTEQFTQTKTLSSIFTNSSMSSQKFDGIPTLTHVIWEEKHGKLMVESKIPEPASFTETLLRKRRPSRHPLSAKAHLHQSGDGTIPYISLMWAHTWLLHATRAMSTLDQTVPFKEGEQISISKNALDSIKVSHRPKGGSEWLEGYGADACAEENGESRLNIGDTGTLHPHGTRYKPKMVRFQSLGKSRTTGMKYTTTVIEAIGVEHKETTRNYDILAAAFTDMLKNLHDDYGLV